MGRDEANLEEVREYAVKSAQERYGWTGTFLSGTTRQEILESLLSVREEWVNAGRIGGLLGKE